MKTADWAGTDENGASGMRTPQIMGAEWLVDGSCGGREGKSQVPLHRGVRIPDGELCRMLPKQGRRPPFSVP